MLIHRYRYRPCLLIRRQPKQAEENHSVVGSFQPVDELTEVFVRCD